ncbi:Protein PER1-like protein [Lachnellula occidentalis]|uniref:Post-GPI attachment to proteins factor 3 n=1 Tax=Lachnellula occidentalis TaxID=215460 RepID=A0A8H8S3S3_9HELO|nr:Protein PER1-like protein [Lachnellula occidentalis]
MILRQLTTLPLWLLFLAFTTQVYASYGDQLPEFQECVEVCKRENCGSRAVTVIPPLHRLLLWDCPAECDYACQHIITDRRVAADEEITQFHGKWPFYRFLGMQEPFSVFFSLLNFLAHQNGLSKVTSNIPASYPLRKYYVLFAYFGMASWIFSMLFHMRDFKVTEQLDYFAAGASILYGFYYTPIRVFRMDQGGKKTKSVRRFWTILCISMYVAHVAYLKLFKWDYTYNMAANVILGVLQNSLWSWFSFEKYRHSGRLWATWPGLAVAWIILAMSLELFDFPPVWGCLDAHSLWHLGTVGPTMIWYNFLLKDAQDDIAGERLKA